MRRLYVFACVLVAVIGVPALGFTQWIRYPTPDLPRKDGKPDFAAPTPRLPDGKPDHLDDYGTKDHHRPVSPAGCCCSLAAVAVAFAAADTYVVVLALPDMMAASASRSTSSSAPRRSCRASCSGYVAMLPLIGRIADLRGRVPVLVARWSSSRVGSLVTAAAYDLPSMVTGRFLQGVGGGGLVPATLALVADLYPADRRGVPLGVVVAVQELGSVLGPLYGALVLAVSGLARRSSRSTSPSAWSSPPPSAAPAPADEPRGVDRHATGRPDWLGGARCWR